MLTKKQMQQLKPGDRCKFSDGVKGTVTDVNKHCIGVDWEDGQSGYIAVEDGQELSLEGSELHAESIQ